MGNIPELKIANITRMNSNGEEVTGVYGYAQVSKIGQEWANKNKTPQLSVTLKFIEDGQLFECQGSIQGRAMETLKDLKVGDNVFCGAHEYNGELVLNPVSMMKTAQRISTSRLSAATLAVLGGTPSEKEVVVEETSGFGDALI